MPMATFLFLLPIVPDTQTSSSFHFFFRPCNDYYVKVELYTVQTPASPPVSIFKLVCILSVATSHDASRGTASTVMSATRSGHCYILSTAHQSVELTPVTSITHSSVAHQSCSYLCAISRAV